ncbi:preprotein translocase subunit YajC [Microbacterium sp. Leaf179]|uniref:preprotein translocase subunit YajC n=1 Tax=Microbacterium sp. Leaf179 TaxID=1736288 RepID=UPI0006F91975|nr:preprotein translocase subunit YajC [Microbacterium sp. Leaf179]KQR85122.1 preprotein translocase subunit YajC [Microbacterium sp. Leaf179]
MDIARFFADYGIIILLIGLLVFMFYSSRRRMKKQKADIEQKARETVPGAEVLLQGGLYGTIVEYDGEDLDKPAHVEIAPGVVIKVHSQAVLRIVNPAEGFVTEDDFIDAEEAEAEYVAGVADGDITSISDDRRAARHDEHTEAGLTDAERADKDRPQA